MPKLLELLRRVEVLLESSDVRNDIVAFEAISQVKLDLQYGVEIPPENMEYVNLYTSILGI